VSRCTLDQCSDLLVNIIWKVYNKSFLISDSKNWLSLWNGRTVLFPYHTCDIYNRKEMVSVNHLFPVPPYFKEYIPCRERLYICPSRQPSSRPPVLCQRSLLARRARESINIFFYSSIPHTAGSNSHTCSGLSLPAPAPFSHRSHVPSHGRSR